jgi:hypothetical protein
MQRVVGSNPTSRLDECSRDYIKTRCLTASRFESGCDSQDSHGGMADTTETTVSADPVV